MLTVTSATELGDYLSAWEALAHASDRPFSAPGWALAWFDHLGPAGGLLRILLVVRAGELIGVLPLFTKARALPGARRYQLLGAGTAIHLEPLATPGTETVVAQALGEGLRALRPAGHLLSLDGIPVDSPWPRLLGRAWQGAGRPILGGVTRSEPVPVVRLSEAGFEGWLGSRPASYRKQLRRAHRALDGAGGTCERATTAELPTAVEDLVRQHEDRWRSRGGSRMMSVGLQQLLRELARRPATAPTFQVIVLRSGPRIVGAQAVMSGATRRYAWFQGFDAAAASFSPGHLLLEELIRDGAVAGAAAVDLGHGRHDYKFVIADDCEVVVWFTLLTPGLGQSYRRATLIPRRLRARLSRAMPAGVAVHVRRTLNVLSPSRR